MLKRNMKITFRLNESEHKKFKTRVKKSGLCQEEYLRQLINDFVPMDAPPLDYFAMMRELHYIGVNLNQIAQKAHTLNVLDYKRYIENINMHNKAVVEITNAVMLPRKIERKNE